MPRSHTPCPDFLADFSGFVDGTLPAPRRSKIQAHFDGCEPCLRHLSAYRRGVARIRNADVEVDGAAFWSRLEERMWVDGHLAAEVPRPARPAPDWRQPVWAIGAAAVFAVAVFGAGLWSSSQWPGGESLPRRVVVAGAATTTPDTRDLNPAADPGPVENGMEPAAIEVAAGPGTRPAADPRPSVPRPDRSIVLAGAGADPAPERAEPEPASGGNWVEREFRRLEEDVQRGTWERTSPPAWANGWADPLEVRPTPIGGTRIRTAGFAPRAGLQIWPVEAAVSIP